MLRQIIARPAAHLHRTQYVLRGSCIIQIQRYFDIIQNWLLGVELGKCLWPCLAVKPCDAKIIKRLFFGRVGDGRVKVVAKQVGDFVVGDGFGRDSLVNMFKPVLVVDAIRRKNPVTHCDAENVVVLPQDGLRRGCEDVFRAGGIGWLVEVF